MNRMLTGMLLAGGLGAAFQVTAQVTLYEHDNYGGRSFVAQRSVANFARSGFNDRASSAKVRGGRWEACTDAQYSGRCVILQRGDYPSLRDLGLNDQVSSIRPVTRGYRSDRSQEGAYERRREENRR